MLLVSSCSRLYPIRWSQVLSWEWRCSWSSADGELTLCKCISACAWVCMRILVQNNSIIVNKFISVLLIFIVLFYCFGSFCGMLTAYKCNMVWLNRNDRPLFTKRADILPPTSGSRVIGRYKDPIGLKFDRHLGSAALEVPVKFQSDWKV